MRRNLTLTFLIMLTSVRIAFSQELSIQVLVPIAGITSVSGLEYTYTIGESATEVLSSDRLVFTQGFQQPRFILRPDVPPAGNGVKVFPSPARDNISIEFFGEGSKSFRVEIFNISGVLMTSEEVQCEGSFWQINNYPVGKYSRGLYFVRILSSDGLIKRIFKIEKL